MMSYILKAEELDKFNIPYLEHNNTLYIQVLYADKLIEFCEHNYIFILGIEGFRFENQFIMPDMKYIADFSSLVFKKENFNLSYYHAKIFLQLIDKKDRDLFLEFILERAQ